MPLYHWRGPEKDLLGPACVAVELTIEHTEVRGEERHAKGKIVCIDYAEHGIRFSNPWEGTGPEQSSKGDRGGPRANYGWTVWRPEVEGELFVFRDGEAGEPQFTISPRIDKAIKRFVAEQLHLFLSGTPAPELRKYDGPLTPYTGPCVCGILAEDLISTFDWEAATGGGQFPRNCFACSCGRKWWYCRDLNVGDFGWGPVADEEAWEMLLEHDGVPVRRMTFMEEGLPAGFYLVQTIRDAGFIPLPS